MTARYQTRSARSATAMDLELSELMATGDALQSFFCAIDPLETPATSLDGPAELEDRAISAPPTPTATASKSSAKMKTTERSPEQERVKGLNIDEGSVDSDGHAIPSIAGKRLTSLTPQEIRELAAHGDKKDLSRHPNVFYTRGRFAHEIKPEYAWTVLLQDKESQHPLPEERLKVVFPEYKFFPNAVFTKAAPTVNKGKKRKLKTECDIEELSEVPPIKKRPRRSSEHRSSSDGETETYVANEIKALMDQQNEYLDRLNTMVWNQENGLLDIRNAQRRLEESQEEIKAALGFIMMRIRASSESASEARLRERLLKERIPSIAPAPVVDMLVQEAGSPVSAMAMAVDVDEEKSPIPAVEMAVDTGEGKYVGS